MLRLVDAKNILPCNYNADFSVNFQPGMLAMLKDEATATVSDGSSYMGIIDDINEDWLLFGCVSTVAASGKMTIWPLTSGMEFATDQVEDDFFEHGDFVYASKNGKFTKNINKPYTYSCVPIARVTNIYGTQSKPTIAFRVL